jgi:hypothetical protein
MTMPLASDPPICLVFAIRMTEASNIMPQSFPIDGSVSKRRPSAAQQHVNLFRLAEHQLIAGLHLLCLS